LYAAPVVVDTKLEDNQFSSSIGKVITIDAELFHLISPVGKRIGNNEPVKESLINSMENLF
jgi:hypothetical protein